MINKRRFYSIALGLTASSVALFASAPGAWANTGSRSAPPGNNGTIKIDQYVVDSGNDNDPHVTCDFSVSFFGFDSGQQHATVTVTPWAPTTGGSPYRTSGSWTTANRTSGSQYDYSIQVSASDLSSSLAGVQPKKQGYHLRLEAEVSGSRGSDDKYKVFWLQPCSSGTPRAASTNTASTSTGGPGQSGPTTNGTTGGTSPSVSQSTQSSARYSVLSSPAPATATASAPAATSAPSAVASVPAASPARAPAALGGLNTSPAARSAVVPASLGASRSSARVPVAMGGLNSAGAARSAPSVLAFTGANIAGTAAGGLALIGLGTILTLRSRRRIGS